MSETNNGVVVEAAHEDVDAALKEKNEFDEVLAEAVYEGLSWISNLVAPALQAYLQDATTIEVGLRKPKLNTQDAKVLQKSLERIFGFGAKVIEYRILEILYAKLRMGKEIEQNFNFSSEVEKAKQLYKSQLCAGERSINEKCMLPARSHGT